MPKVTIYVNEEIYDSSKALAKMLKMNYSKFIQAALLRMMAEILKNQTFDKETEE